MSAPSGRRRRYVEVNTLNEGWRQTAREATDSSTSNFSPSLCFFFPFLSFFSPPRSLVSQPVGVGWWRAPEMGSGLAAPDRAVLMGADDD